MAMGTGCTGLMNRTCSACVQFVWEKDGSKYRACMQSNAVNHEVKLQECIILLMSMLYGITCDVKQAMWGAAQPTCMLM
jgi:hypothetical protein